MTWLAQAIAGSRLVQGILTVLAAVGAVLAALASARRSGRREGRSEVEAEQGRATIETYRRRDEATRKAPKSTDELVEKARKHRL